MLASAPSLRNAYELLLCARALERPSGRPLYEYRFTRTEYEDLGLALRQAGRRFLDDFHGAALFVAFTAEWFRRERAGGAWDWIQPLKVLGVSYHSTNPVADVRYPQVRSAADRGLAIWRRTIPSHGSVLLAVVREAGFPAASLREGPGLSSWLRRSVLGIESGLTPEEAVAGEAWRAGETLVQALYEPAVELSRIVADLRRRLTAADAPGFDPVQRLDSVCPNWRSELPFDVETNDVRLLVEDLVGARTVEASGLGVVRRLRKSERGWIAVAELVLDGFVEQKRLPADAAFALANAGRVRVRPAGDLADFGRPLLAMERLCDEEVDGWELRPLVQGFEAPLRLEQELRLAAVAGDVVMTEFIAFAGDPIAAPVVALQPTGPEQPKECPELEVLGASPAKSRKPWLALAVEPSEFDRLRFENTPIELGRCDDGRRLVAFSGRAELHLGRDVLVWRSGAAEDSSLKLVLVGSMVQRAIERVFLGTPRAWLAEEESVRPVQARDLRWRAIGSSQWHAPSEVEPLGKVEFAVRRKGELVAWTRALVVPSTFNLVAEPRARKLLLRGQAGATVTAGAAQAYPVAQIGDAAVVDLTEHPAGASLRLGLRWNTTVELLLPDPIAEPMLLDPESQPVARAGLSVSALAGYQLLAPDLRRLCFELHSSDAPGLHAYRSVEGSTPLAAFSDLLRSMLAGSTNLDASVRLTWMGRGDWLAEVRLYDLDRPLYLPDEPNPFAAAAAALDLRLSAFSLPFPAAGVATNLPVLPARDARERLQADLADGPWILLGSTADGHRLRPKMLGEQTDPASPSTPLVAAITERKRDVREVTMRSRLAQAEALLPEECRLLVDLCVTAKAAQAPYACVEALAHLCYADRAAIFVLATCDSPAEREAVLALQDELPLLWFLTPIEAWIVAFGQRAEMLTRRLVAAQLPTDTALSSTGKALAHIVDLQPGLRVHAQTAFLFGCEGATQDRALVERLCRPPERSLADLTDALIKRAGDRAEPPPLPRLVALTPEMEPLRCRFDDSFGGLISAPMAAARIATGEIRSDAGLAEACRVAWLYDRDHFEATLTRALQDLSSKSHLAKSA
jgi:hypothetical protein